MFQKDIVEAIANMPKEDILPVPGCQRIEVIKLCQGVKEYV